MIKAIRKACFYLGLFGAMCVFVYAVAHAAYRQGEINATERQVKADMAENVRIITVAYAAHLKTPIDWDLLEPRRVLPTTPRRKPE